MTRTRQSAATTSVLDRSPPQDLESERGVLGSLLLDPRRADDVALVLKSTDFFKPSHRTLYEHMMTLHNKGKAIDLTLLTAALKKAGEYETVGGMDYLVKILESSPTAYAAVDYARHVVDSAQLRGLVHAATDTLREAYEPAGEDVPTIMARAEGRMFSLAERRVSTEVASFGDVLMEALASIDERTPGAKRGLMSGYVDLDDKLGGFRGGQLIILAGRPAMGKTQAAVCIASNAMTNYGAKVLFVSLEMSRHELAERLMSSFAKVPLHALTNNLMSPTERQRIVQASSELSELPLTIDDTAERTVTEIAAVCRREKRKRGLDLVIVDYLTIVKPDNDRDQREEQVAKIARHLKTLARELNVPIVCMAQLNREVAKAGDNIPQLHHLRSSGAIEQDADVVLFLHRPEYYATSDRDREALAGKAELHIAKARNAKCGVVKLHWNGEWGRFETAAKSREWNGEYDIP